jgi:excisionase family DNA binding protein
MANSTITDRKLNVREAAEYLNLSKSTMDKLRVSGGGPKYHQLGRRISYSREALSEWAAKRTKSSTSDLS